MPGEATLAVYWNFNGVSYDLNIIGFGEAYDVSSDGEVIVGTTGQFGFVWQRGFIKTFLVNQKYCRVRGVSPNGVFITGEYLEVDTCWNASLNRGFVAYTDAPVIDGTIWGVPLPSIGDGNNHPYCLSDSLGFAVSDTGLIVGTSFMGLQSENRSFVATSWFPLTKLGSHLPGDVDVNSYVYDVSADGQISVGHHDGVAYGAVRWMNSLEENLNTVFRPRPCGLAFANSISRDGRYIVGSGYRFEQTAFVLDSHCSPIRGDVDGNGCVDDTDLISLLAGMGTSSPFLDVNCDGYVDDMDLLEVIANLGAGC